jgi:hypothetical protein
LGISPCAALYRRCICSSILSAVPEFESALLSHVYLICCCAVKSAEMFKRPGSVSKSAFGVNYDSSRQQQQPAGNAPRADGPPPKRARTEQLPAEQVRRELLYLVENHATVVVVGETGCGKTTQIPRFLHEAGWTADGYQVGGGGPS